MLLKLGPEPTRQARTEDLSANLVIVGAGTAGICAAITAARQGLNVILVHDRPVPGGNASSEIRLWILGATCHMGSNNRWAREGGVLSELLTENLYRNPEGNPLIFDTIVLEWLMREPNIKLLLNTAAFDVAKTPGDPDRIASVRAFCSQNSTMYVLSAPLFLDSSGDGIVGFLAGAAFRMGAETPDEFGEGFAPTGDFGHLLGDSIYFYSKDMGKPVPFVAPSFAIKNVPERIPRYRQFNAKSQACHLWWIEYGGRLDTVHQAEDIKWELWKIVYGVWDYIKNSGNFPDAANLALEWVGHIPGKRESRRFEGPYMLRQSDVVARPNHYDAVAFGGWSIDLHPADGVYSTLAGSHHLHSKGPYQIPYRCLYSRNIKNLFLGGRIISASHVAFGSTRVMATGAHGGQAVGVAAAVCAQMHLDPHALSDPARITLVQERLKHTGQHLWNNTAPAKDDLAPRAKVSASSRFQLRSLPADGPMFAMTERDVAQVLPLPAGKVPTITLTLDAAADTQLVAELRTSSRLDHLTPDVLLAEVSVAVRAGTSVPVTLAFEATVVEPRFVLVVLRKNPALAVHCTNQRLTGLLMLQKRRDEKTSSVGGEDYEVWAPPRRPGGHNLALALSAAIDLWGPHNVASGATRPTHLPNAWIADLADHAPAVSLAWDAPQTISRVQIFFDTDYEHPMETVTWGHPERVIPFCVKRFRLLDQDRRVLHECTENHHARYAVELDPPVTLRGLTVEILESNDPHVPATVMEITAQSP